MAAPNADGGNWAQLYVSRPFDDVADMLADAIARAHWSTHARLDPDRDMEPFQREHVELGGGYEDDGEWPWARLWASPARSFLEMGGGVCVYVRDARWAQQRELLGYDSFPLVVQRELPDLGCLVAIEGYRYAGFAEDGADLCAAALNGDAATTAVRRLWRNDLVGVASGALEPGAGGEVDTVDALTQAVTQGHHSLPELPLSRFRPGLVDVIGDVHPNAQRCLRTAEFLAPFMVEQFDASAVIVQYTKAVEIEFLDKFLVPLKVWWAARPTPAQIAKKGPLQKLYNALFGTGHLELGSLAFSIREACKPAWDGDPVAESVRMQLGRFPDPGWAHAALAEDMAALARDPRNPASHTTMFSAQALPAVRARVLGDVDSPGLLERIHTAPELEAASA